jgi:hypothetical protein
MGRPSIKTDEKLETILTEIVEGKSLREICMADGMPTVATVFKWLSEDTVFSEKYTRAREAQQDTYADEITFIADTEPDPQKARVRIDARKWHASKLAPKKYGDKVDLTHANPDGSNITFQTVFEPKPDR